MQWSWFLTYHLGVASWLFRRPLDLEKCHFRSRPFPTFVQIVHFSGSNCLLQRGAPVTVEFWFCFFLYIFFIFFTVKYVALWLMSNMRFCVFNLSIKRILICQNLSPFLVFRVTLEAKNRANIKSDSQIFYAK